jgi:hypothetical protein
VSGKPVASQVLKSGYSEFSIVEYPLGYPIDAISGATWDYPKTLVVRFGGLSPGIPINKSGT